ncbi:MAG: Hsp70 family protein, partial [Okeania sp. SIO2H7]|nr:Hsp70 family protein [Okeania sp. SIO2H7]
FDLDANGILKVTAVDKGTGREQSIEITNTGGLSEAEIEKMQKEAELYAEKDEKQKQAIELKNQAETLFYNYESALEDHEEFIDEELKAEAKREYEALEKAIEDDDISYDELKEKVDIFKDTLFAMGESVYAGSGGTGGGGKAESAGPEKATETLPPPEPKAEKKTETKEEKVETKVETKAKTQKKAPETPKRRQPPKPPPTMEMPETLESELSPELPELEAEESAKQEDSENELEKNPFL